MKTISITLPDDAAAFVEEEVARGAYRSASEVVGEGLDRLRQDTASDEEKLAILRREIQFRLDDMEAGRFSDRTIEEIARDVLSGVGREV